MTDLQPIPLNDTTHFLCLGYRAINGLARHRGEVFDGTGMRNVSELIEMNVIARTSELTPTIDVEYDGQTRHFVNDAYADLFIDWAEREAAAEAEAEAEVIVSEVTEPEDTTGYEAMTKAILSDMLAEREIEYKASMTKDELIALLREDDNPTPYSERTNAQLHDMLTERDIAFTTSMVKDELVALLEAADAALPELDDDGNPIVPNVGDGNDGGGTPPQV